MFNLESHLEIISRLKNIAFIVLGHFRRNVRNSLKTSDISRKLVYMDIWPKQGWPEG